MPKILNPLDHVEVPTAQESTSSDGGQQASTSAYNANDTAGVCPRCSSVMDKARVIRPPDIVYFCQSCRITTPMTDADCIANDAAIRAAMNGA